MCKLLTKNWFLLALILTLYGCTQPNYIAPKEVVYIGIPIPCDVPDVICDFKGSWMEPTQKLIECIKEQKMVIQACSGGTPPEQGLGGIKAEYQDLGSTTY